MTNIPYWSIVYLNLTFSDGEHLRREESEIQNKEHCSLNALHDILIFLAQRLLK